MVRHLGWSALGAERLDVRAGAPGDPPPVKGEQRHYRVLGGGAKSGGDQERVDLVALPARSRWDS
jgi:hypothetical protein